MKGLQGQASNAEDAPERSCAMLRKFFEQQNGLLWSYGGSDACLRVFAGPEDELKLLKNSVMGAASVLPVHISTIISTTFLLCAVYPCFNV